MGTKGQQESGVGKDGRLKRGPVLSKDALTFSEPQQ